MFLSPFPSTIVQESPKVLHSRNEFQWRSLAYPAWRLASAERERSLWFYRNRSIREFAFDQWPKVRWEPVERSKREYDAYLDDERVSERWSHQSGDKTTTAGETAVYRSVDRLGTSRVLSHLLLARTTKRWHADWKSASVGRRGANLLLKIGLVSI
jgi:hypothetical protein